VSLDAGSTLNVTSGGAAYTMLGDATVSGPGTVVVGGAFGGGLSVIDADSIDNLNVGGGSVSIDLHGSLTVQNLVLSGGTVTVAATASLETQTLTQTGGTLTGAGPASIDGTLTWAGGVMSGTGHTVVNGNATVGGDTFGPTLDTRTLDNAGTLTVPDGKVLLFANNALLNNEAGAALTLQGSDSLGNGFGQSGRLSNAGQLVHSGVTNGTSAINIPADNTGTADVQTGTLTFDAGLTNEGELDLEAGTSAGLAAAGNSSGTINLAAGSTLGIGSGFNSGAFTLLNGATVSGPGTVLVAGDVFGSSTLVVTGAATVDNLAVRSGTVSVTGTGSLTVQGLALSGGTVTVAAAAGLDTQTLTQTAGTLNGAGTATVEGTLTWTGGVMSGTGHTVLNGDATVGQGPFGPTLDTRTLDNAGTITVPNGKVLLFANNALLNNKAGGTLTLQGSGSLGNFFGQSGRLSNAGQLFTTGNGQAAINFAVTNSGTVDLQGVLSIGGNYTQTAGGTLNIHLGGTTVGSQYDQLQVHGVAALDGTLNVTLVNGFAPAAGNNFRILTFNSRSGDFAAMNLPDPGNGLALNPAYDGSGLTLLTQPAGA
jgi:hypothetical protein